MRPMSEAPRDGTKILVKLAEPTLQYVRSRITSERFPFTLAFFAQKHKDDYWPNACWYGSDYSFAESELLGWWSIEELIADHERLNKIEAYPYRINLAYDSTTPKDTGLPTMREEIDYFFEGDKS